MHLPKSGRISLVQIAFFKYTECGAVLCLVQSVNRASNPQRCFSWRSFGCEL